MAVTAQTPYTSYTAAPGAVTFSTEFRVIRASDLVVRVNGVTQTTGFTLIGLGDAGGVDVQFSVSMVGGEFIELFRVVPLTRATDYQQLGDFLSPVVNQDFDRLWMSQQDQGFLINGALRLPFPEQVASLPAAAGRTRKLFYFNETGAPVMLGGTPNTVLGFDNEGDAVSVAPTSGSATDLALSLAGTGGAGQVGSQQAGAGAVPQTLAARNANLILATDYATIQQALDAAGEAKTVIIPESYAGTDTYDDCIYNAVIDLRKIPNGPPTNRVSGIGIGSVITTNGDSVFPMGHDLVMRAKGSSDMYLEHLNIRCTTTQTLVPGVNDITISAVTVGNSTRGNVYVGNAYLFAEAGSMMIDRETDDEEQVNPPNIQILNATTIRLTLTRGHTGTTDIEMIGSTLLSGWDLFVGSGLTKPVGNTTWDAPLRLKDLGGRIIAKIPGNIDNGPPHGMWQWGCMQTGLFGVNRHLYYKHNLSTSRVIWRSAADVDIATLDNDGRLTVSAGVGGGSAALRTDGDVGELQVGGRITVTPSSTTDAFLSWMGATSLNPSNTSGSLGVYARNIANAEVVIGAQNTANFRVRGNQAGFFGVTPVNRQTLPAAATDAATTQALANAIRSALIALGLAQ